MGGNFKNKSRFNRRGRNRKNFQCSDRNNSSNNKTDYRHQEQLSETDVAITEFISKLEGFSGIIKARFSDFQVNEIDMEGNVAKLTDTSIPKDFRKKIEKFEIKPSGESPVEQIPQQIWDSIKAMIDTDSSEPIRMDAENMAKEDRMKVHECVKSIFKQKIIASTITENDKKFMEFKKYNKDVKTDDRNQWPADKPEYVHFLVYKESIDTLEVASKISSCLNIATANLNYAGVKDKRAKTTQWFSVRKVEPWKLVIKTRPLRNVKVGNITFKEVPLKLGQLSGNLFRIALRNVTASKEQIDEAMEMLKQRGFINYYGLQRFGNDKAVPTYEIGLQLLLGNWKEVANLILKPKQSDDPLLYASKAKKVFHETGDAKKALSEFCGSNCGNVEYKLLVGLSKGHSNDYVNALENIPRNMRLLYIHSFQSFIWNHAVTERIKRFGLEPVEGDIILIKEEIQEVEIGEADMNCEGHSNEVKNNQEVKALTVEDLKNYTIYDVVLPLPGYDILYPEFMKDFYKNILEKYGLSLEMPKQSVKTYTLSGTYRKIVSEVKDISWKILRYNLPTDNLIRSDFEELRGFSEPKDVENGQFKALVMTFSLKSSSYATMVLREIMKVDTSTSAQAKLNNYFLPTDQSQPSNSKKIIIDSENNVEEDNKFCEMSEGSSLLADKEKYNDFRNNIFNIINEPVKRKMDEDDGDESDEVKKVKIDGIKMEASMV